MATLPFYRICASFIITKKKSIYYSSFQCCSLTHQLCKVCCAHQWCQQQYVIYQTKWGVLGILVSGHSLTPVICISDDIYGNKVSCVWNFWIVQCVNFVWYWIKYIVVVDVGHQHIWLPVKRPCIISYDLTCEIEEYEKILGTLLSRHSLAGSGLLIKHSSWPIKVHILCDKKFHFSEWSHDYALLQFP